MALFFLLTIQSSNFHQATLAECHHQEFAPVHLKPDRWLNFQIQAKNKKAEFLTTVPQTRPKYVSSRKSGGFRGKFTVNNLGITLLIDTAGECSLVSLP